MVQQRLTKPCKILLLRVPSDLMGNRRGVAEGRRLHQLKILLILHGGAAGRLVHPFACVVLAGSAKTRECSEEMIVRAQAGAGHKAAHREGIDEPVVEILVSRNRRCRNQWCRAGRLDEAQRNRVHAQAVLACRADEALRVDRPG